LDELLRLVEIDLQKEDQNAVLNWCDRILEIDPMRSSIQEFRATAAEALGNPAQAVESLHALIALEPIDMALIQYRLAKALLAIEQKADAKRHVLLALEESPRYRDALALLLRILESP
jgi:tetratricopeptide (TPR) repeat protein